MFQQIKWRFHFAVISSSLLILFAAFEWSLMEIFNVFLMLPLVGAVWGFFIGCTIASLTCLFKFKVVGLKSFAPIGVQVIAFLVVVYVPFTVLWLKADYQLNKEQRTAVVTKVLHGELKTNVEYNSSHIHLGDDDSGISRGGDDIVVEKHDGLTYVLFFTFRGLLDNYSGYLYVPEGGSPKMFGDLNESEVTEIEHIEGNWYFVSHH